MAEVKLKENESLDNALRRLRSSARDPVFLPRSRDANTMKSLP